MRVPFNVQCKVPFRPGAQWSSRLFAGVLLLAASRPVFDLEVLIGGTGKVRSIYDVSDATRTHVFDQSNTALQVAPPAMHADYLRPCYTFTGAERYTSNRASSYWVVQHNGVSCGFNAVCTPTAANSRLVSSRNSSAGFLWGINNPTNWLLFVGPGVVLGPGASLPLSVPRQVAWRYTEGAGTPESTYKVTGASAVTGDSSASPSAGNPDGTMTLGANPDTSLPFVGRLCPPMVFPPDLGASGFAQMQNTLFRLTGVAA